MDKTIEIVVVATVGLLTALILMVGVENQSGSFSDFLDNQSDSASCKTMETRYKQCMIDESKLDPDCDIDTSVERRCSHSS